MNLISKVRCGIYEYYHIIAQVIRDICNLETLEKREGTTRRAWPDRTKSDENGLSKRSCRPACIYGERYIQDSRLTKFAHKDRRRVFWVQVRAYDDLCGKDCKPVRRIDHAS
jgi:hypothetical protein